MKLSLKLFFVLVLGSSIGLSIFLTPTAQAVTAGQPTTDPIPTVAKIGLCGGKIDISWNKADVSSVLNAKGYYIYRFEKDPYTEESPYIIIKIQNINIVTYTDVGLKFNTRYWYYVLPVTAEQLVRSEQSTAAIILAQASVSRGYTGPGVFKTFGNVTIDFDANSVLSSGPCVVSPDLTANTPYSPNNTNITFGSAISIHGIVSNDNVVDVTKPFNNLFQISPDNFKTVSTIEALSPAQDVNGIFVNKSTHSLGGINKGVSVEVPSYNFVPTQTGTYYIRLCADLPDYDFGIISESNESNNCSGGLKITVVPPPVTNSFDYSLSAIPNLISLVAGTSGNLSIQKVLLTGSTQQVKLSIVDLDGLGVSITSNDPSNPTSSSNVVVSTSAATAIRLHTVTVQGTSLNTPNKKVTFSVNVTAPEPIIVTNTLTITTSGTGAGSVTSNPAGIGCTRANTITSGVCAKSFAKNSLVTLTATPASNSTFIGWSGGGCSEIGVCNVIMDVSKIVNAEFTLALIKLVGPTAPIITPSAGACGGHINLSYGAGTGATSYKLYRGMSDPGPDFSVPTAVPYSQIGGIYTFTTLPTEDPDTIIPHIIAGARYFYQLEAINAVGSAYSQRPRSAVSDPCFDYALSNSGNVSIINGQSIGISLIKTLLAGVTQPVTIFVTSVNKSNGAPVTPADNFTVTLSKIVANHNPSSPTSPATNPSVVSVVTSLATPIDTYTVTVIGAPLGKSTQFSIAVGPRAPSVTLSVRNSKTAPSGAYSHGSIIVGKNDRVDLQWTSENVTSCSAPTWTTQTTALGTELSIGPLTNSQYIFTINCVGVGGITHDSVTVNVLTTPVIPFVGNPTVPGGTPAPVPIAPVVTINSIINSCAAWVYRPIGSSGVLTQVLLNGVVYIGEPVYWKTTPVTPSIPPVSYTYLWSGSEALSASGLTTVAKRYSTLGIKTATLTVIADTGAVGTRVCDQVKTVVNPEFQEF